MNTYCELPTASNAAKPFFQPGAKYPNRKNSIEGVYLLNIPFASPELLEIIYCNNMFTMDMTDYKSLYLVRENEESFLIPQINRRFTIQRNQEGAVTGLILQNPFINKEIAPLIASKIN